MRPGPLNGVPDQKDDFGIWHRSMHSCQVLIFKYRIGWGNITSDPILQSKQRPVPGVRIIVETKMPPPPCPFELSCLDGALDSVSGLGAVFGAEDSFYGQGFCKFIWCRIVLRPIKIMKFFDRRHR